MTRIRQANELRLGDRVELIRGKDAAAFLLPKDSPALKAASTRHAYVHVDVASLALDEAGAVEVSFALTAVSPGLVAGTTSEASLGHHTVVFPGREAMHVASSDPARG